MHARPHEFCWYCGVKLQGHDSKASTFRTRDHVVPKSGGGRGSTNYVEACLGCNQKKGILSLDEFRRALGGGLFWGEVFSMQVVNGTLVRAHDRRLFTEWFLDQGTPRAGEWYARCHASRALRGPTVVLLPEVDPLLEQAVSLGLVELTDPPEPAPPDVGLPAKQAIRLDPLQTRRANPDARYHLRMAVAVTLRRWACWWDPECT